MTIDAAIVAAVNVRDDFITRRAEPGPGRGLGDWGEALAGLDLAAARLVKAEGGTAVYFAELLGQAVVLKRWTLRSRADAVKAFVHASRAERHWRGSQRLIDLGIPTAHCLAIIDQGKGRTRERWLIMQRLPGRSALAHLASADLPTRTQHALARELAHHFTSLRHAGVVNRDPKPSNLIVTSTDAEVACIAMIDCVAIRRGGRRRWLRSMAMLAIEPIGCGVPIRRGLIARFIATVESGGKGERLKLWRQLGEIVRGHGSAVPRVNPLG